MSWQLFSPAMFHTHKSDTAILKGQHSPPCKNLTLTLELTSQGCLIISTSKLVVAAHCEQFHFWESDVRGSPKPLVYFIHKAKHRGLPYPCFLALTQQYKMSLYSNEYCVEAREQE